MSVRSHVWWEVATLITIMLLGHRLDNIDLEQSECRGKRGSKRNHYAEADQRHHPRSAIGEFSPSAANKRAFALQENNRAQNGRDILRGRKSGSGVAKPVLNLP